MLYWNLKLLLEQFVRLLTKRLKLERAGVSLHFSQRKLLKGFLKSYLCSEPKECFKKYSPFFLQVSNGWVLTLFLRPRCLFSLFLRLLVCKQDCQPKIKTFSSRTSRHRIHWIVPLLYFFMDFWPATEMNKLFYRKSRDSAQIPKQCQNSSQWN